MFAGDKPQLPDLLRGGQRDNAHDITLGPTGMRGWIWAWRAQTTDARQILVTEVAVGSPADGIFRNSDVIIGVDGKPFGEDARICFGRAITEAEKESGKGVLRLIRWRNGQSENVTLKLAVMGTYSFTAPYGCQKSKKILDMGCRAIVEQGWKDKHGNIHVCIQNALNALALLASGREEYLPHIAEYARTVAGLSRQQIGNSSGGHISWGYAYETLFLAEYYLATHDESILPGLKRLAVEIAIGQSAVGTWGHSFARPEDGILNGYGCMNQPGIILTMAMAVAREAGIKSPELDRAIGKSGLFLRRFSGKGAIPYGDHAPWIAHDNNGVCSSAAILFDLLAEQEPASFFSRMSVAAYAERETGHTGIFFSLLWALPGVSRCGPVAAGAYMKETSWYYDLARKWDGRFVYQGEPGVSRSSYDGWDVTGAYLLSYALPVKRTVVTGRKPSIVVPLSAKAVAETITAGVWNFWNGQEMYYDRKSPDELMTGLTSWSPAVRERSAVGLSRKEGNFVPKLLTLLNSTNRDARYGACEALGLQGAKADTASIQIRALLKDKDPWMRELAANAIAKMGDSTRRTAVSDLLQAVLVKDPADPRRCLQGALTEVLFKPAPGKREPKSILADSLDGIDRPLLVSVVKDVLKSEDGRIRRGVSDIYKKLTAEEIAVLLSDIVEAVRKPAPSGEMFAYDIRFAGLDLLSYLQIREGMSMCVDIMDEFRWGRKLNRCVDVLSRYGGAAGEMVPRLKATRQALVEKNKNWEKNEEQRKEVESIDKLILKIKTDRNPPYLRSMAEFIKTPSIPVQVKDRK
jgi:hypothetical protein